MEVKLDPNETLIKCKYITKMPPLTKVGRDSHHFFFKFFPTLEYDKFHSIRRYEFSKNKVSNEYIT